MILTVILFIVILSVLVFAHEFGHFITAKRSGMKVEEFGFGFPPRAWGIKRGETIYSINWIPFGGFVKILGEDGDNRESPKSFGSKSAWRRVLVLIAGVAMNVILAFVLLIVVNIVGLRVGFSDDNVPAGAKNVMVQIIQVADNSPAQRAGLQLLDQVKDIKADGRTTDIENVQQVQSLINANKNRKIVIDVQRGSQVVSAELTPRVNPPPGEGAIGISLSATGVMTYPWYRAIYQGLVDTWTILAGTVLGYAAIFKNIFTTGKAGVQLSGPVGIAVVTGQAARLGFAYILQFMALISVNLAVLNFIPFPALDGGRLLFVAIEKIKGSPISKKVENAVNSFGFAFLVILMIYITTKDIIRLIPGQ